MNGQRSMKLGYYADYTNSAQNGVAIETLNEITRLSHFKIVGKVWLHIENMRFNTAFAL